jgi:hypothetical protein
VIHCVVLCVVDNNHLVLLVSGYKSIWHNALLLDDVHCYLI